PLRIAVLAYLPLALTDTRKREKMDISQSPANTRISRLPGVHRSAEKNGHNDRQNVHFQSQVSQLISSEDARRNLA
ncbi:hypothetical protein, partial [Cupriavidus sp. CP313]